MSTGLVAGGSPSRQCAQCGAQGPTKRCGSCNAVYYCHRGCQETHWKESHQKNCKRKQQKQPTFFQWDTTCAAYSTPGISEDKCTAILEECETSVCSIQPLGGNKLKESVSVSFVWDGSPYIPPSVGVCTKTDSRQLSWWKYRADGTACSSRDTRLRSYGAPFQSCDIITVELKNGGLYFYVNGSPQGEAFTADELMACQADEGPLHVRAHLFNQLPLGQSILPERRTRVIIRSRR